MEFGPAAEPLAAIREDLNFINGLFNQTRWSSPSPHLGRMPTCSPAPR